MGQRLGLQDFFQYTDEEDYLRQQLAPLGVTLEEVREKGYAELPEGDENPFNWNTPSGKVELFSETLTALVLMPCPPGKNRRAPLQGNFTF